MASDHRRWPLMFEALRRVVGRLAPSSDGPVVTPTVTADFPLFAGQLDRLRTGGRDRLRSQGI
jgi:hypothetical protein